MTCGFTFVAYLALVVSLFGSWDLSLLLLAAAALGAVFVVVLLLARVEAEVAAAWTRIVLGGVLLLACGLSWLQEPAPSLGLFTLAAGAALLAGGEVWALRSVPPEESEAAA